jgi:hypothetical protein
MRQKWGKKVSRSKKERNDMEEKQEGRKVRRKFTPEQKFEILKDIERKEGSSPLLAFGQRCFNPTNSPA